MAKTVFDVLDEKLELHVQDALIYLAGGSATSFEAYRDLCGAIRGLRTAQTEIRDFAKNYGDEDD